MSVTGLCQLCADAAATQQCPRCGTLVCDDHFEEADGRCVSCVAEAGRDESGGDTDDGGDGWSDTGPTGPS